MIRNNTIHKDLIKYAQDFAPTIHLTLQWDTNHRTRIISVLEKRLHYFMSRAQREILGRTWHRYHIPFIGFGETNPLGEYHIHILLKDSAHTIACWKKAFDKITARARRTPMPKNPYLQEITPGTEWRVIKYNTKNLRPDRLGNICENSVIITSEYLFARKKRGKQWDGRIL